MNKIPEPSNGSRFKWLILGGFGLMLFFLCGALVLFLPELLTEPRYKQSSETLFGMNPTSKVEVAGTLVSSPTTRVLSATHTPETEKSVPDREIAYVTQVIDGDTIEVFLNEEAQRLRYIGIDSPEIGMPYSDEAKEANRGLVEGQVVELEGDVTDIDQYGRLLRYVYLANGTLVNAELVRLGCAHAVAYPPDVKYQELFIEYESETKAAGIGLWASPEPTVTSFPTDRVNPLVIDSACSQFNAPGNDNDNKNEEYVCFVNQSVALVDMTGWILRDEYGWTYTFPAFTLNPGAAVKVRSGCGQNSTQDLYWCRDETAIWNNDGDCIYLLNAEGEPTIEFCY
jgi:endonuclease YncB( thermonuclease family)